MKYTQGMIKETTKQEQRHNTDERGNNQHVPPKKIAIDIKSLVWGVLLLLRILANSYIQAGIRVASTNARAAFGFSRTSRWRILESYVERS
eukprot:1145331-Amphidinium_carterae.1